MLNVGWYYNCSMLDKMLADEWVKATTGGPHTFGHSDGNHELLQCFDIVCNEWPLT